MTLNQYVPKLQNLQNAKVVVYGYTDKLPVGPALQRAGIKDNINLSSRRADDVVAYFCSQPVNPNISSRRKSLAIRIRSLRTTRPMAPPRTAASKSLWKAPRLTETEK